jgi:tetratricopeptide (TPR) repeat protein
VVGLTPWGYGLLAALLAAGLYGLWRHDRRAALLLGGAVLLFALGYTTYLTLYIRSGLNPAIDENDPETLAAFIKFVNREQYGTESMLLGMFRGRAARAYQFWDLQLKYFLQQFPWPWAQLRLSFRQATEALPDVVAVSLVPYGLGLWGLGWHGRQDWKRGVAVGAMFVVMGFGLSLYLNMPDPQPRERHYVFGGMYLAFALWIGLGWTGLLELVRRQGWLSPRPLAAVAALGLLLPLGTAASLYHTEDRTGDFIAHDYAYNLLASCGPHSILFTNGDNDTFPLWYLQEVEGVRQDVRVVNLSLLNTNWYIKQLRDRTPPVDIRYTDSYIDSVLTDTQQVDLLRRYWPEPKTVRAAGIEWELRDFSGYGLLRVQDVMVLKILEWNEWKRPLHFAITVPASNRIGLDPFTAMEGMVLTLRPQRNPPMDVDRGLDLLYHSFKLRGLNDPAVYKDLNTERLLGNYRAVVAYLADELKQRGRNDELAELLQWSEVHIPFEWESYYTSAIDLQEAGRLDEAGVFMEKGALALMDRLGADVSATPANVLIMADILLDRCKAVDRAQNVYRRVIGADPSNADACFGLAACLQATGQSDSALRLVDEYTARFGDQPRIAEARQLLQNDVQRASGLAPAEAHQ